MKIAIDASRAFLDKRTGIEEYAYRIIESLRTDLKDHEVVLYLRPGGLERLESSFKLPKKWKAKEIPFKYFWTQIGMAWEFLTNSPDVLFIPAHTVPWIHPKKSVVTIHGLEYEHCPESYSLYSRLFHRFFIQKSCKWARKIIAISENTKKDLKNLYGAPTGKMKVVYNGFTDVAKNQKLGKAPKVPFISFVNRIEKRKNVEGIVKAFEILKEKYGYKGKLFLAGKPGHGFRSIKKLIDKSKYSKQIVLKGFVSNDDRLALMKKADLFLYPSFCEGFGFPILEVQSVGTPVVSSNFGPMDEVMRNKSVLADPYDPANIAKVSAKILNDKKFRKKTVEKGRRNIKRFSWEKCGKEVARVLLS